jgi:hypothetical protein
MPFDLILDKAAEARQAMENVTQTFNAGKSSEAEQAFWFLVSGTLISALRYGSLIHRFRSGKVNWVDFDIDIAIACPRDARSFFVEQLLSVLRQSSHAGWTACRAPEKRFDPKNLSEDVAGSASTTMFSPLSFPRSCDDPNVEPIEFHLELLWLDIVKVGRKTDFHLVPDKHWTKEVKSLLGTRGFFERNVILPLRKGSFGGGIGAFIPQQPYTWLQNWNRESKVVSEYGTSLQRLVYPLHRKIANGERWSCSCDVALSREDLQEIADSSRDLDKKGLASFQPYFSEKR